MIALSMMSFHRNSIVTAAVEMRVCEDAGDVLVRMEGILDFSDFSQSGASSSTPGLQIGSSAIVFSNGVFPGTGLDGQTFWRHS